MFSQTPSAYRRLLHDERFHASVAGSRLRYLALSGEAIRRDDIAGWLARGHRARLINTYAITETAGQLTLRIYGADDATEEGARNLGRPLPGREVLVLDAAGRPVAARPALPASSGWAAPASRPATWPHRSWPRASASWPCRARACCAATGPATGCASSPTVRWSTWAGSMPSSSFAATASSPATSRRPCATIPACAMPPSRFRADAAGNQRLTAYVVGRRRRTAGVRRRRSSGRPSAPTASTTSGCTA